MKTPRFSRGAFLNGVAGLAGAALAGSSWGAARAEGPPTQAASAPVAAQAKTYMVTYTYVPECEQRRQPHRAAHFQRLEQSRDQGILVLAGGFSDPVDGALLLVEAGEPGEVLNWVAADPYAQAGLIRGVAVREIGVAVRR